MSDIEIDIEAYGGESRASALADVLELQATKADVSMTESQLADYAADAGWGRRWADKFVDVGEVLDEDPTAKDHAVNAFAALQQRASLLGRLYPFRVDLHNGFLVRRETETAAYDIIFAISLSHAYGLDIGTNPRDYLEELVVRCFRANGLAAECIAKSGGRFEDRLETACSRLGHRAVSTRAIRRRAARDSGVDVLAHIAFPPLRSNLWAAVCQVTCGKSETWEKKLTEAAPLRWKSFLGVAVTPTPLLAVPHHVSDRHLRYLEESHGGMVIDRLRLVKILSDSAADKDLAIGKKVRDFQVSMPYKRPRLPRPV